jgi:FMN phosphatase YigB (HAD superfamily)
MALGRRGVGAKAIDENLVHRIPDLQRVRSTVKMIESGARGEPETLVRPAADRASRQAKALGMKLAILSNELDLFDGAEFRWRLPLLDLCDAIIDATYTGILMPDPRACRLCLDAIARPPWACRAVTSM